MILLDGHSLNAKEKFRPESMQLTIEERKSAATLTVGPEAPEISVGDWMRDDTEPGSGILWRVKSVSTQVERETRTIALEHICATLRDYVIFGEWEPEDGCTAQAAATYALGQTGGLWTLGTWEATNPTNPYKFASCTVMTALENVSATLSGVYWEYDLSQIPFVLHMRLLDDSAASEMRMSRNIVSLRRSIDRSRMYTRIYPIGADDLHITGDYLSKNEAIYGTVSHIETDQSKESETELAAWAQQRLDTHCEPAVSIQISGLDYSRETGEALDRLQICKRCRVPLPEYGTTILETVTRLTWKDKIGKPEEITVNLANIQEDVASIWKKVSGDAASNSRAGGRGVKKKQEEDHAWFVDTTDHVAMVAEAIIGKVEDEDAEHLWSRVSTIVVDGNGIHQRVTATEDGVAAHGTAIEQNEQRISLAVGSYQIDPEKILRYPGGVSTFPSEGQTGYFYLDTSVTPNRMYIWKNGKYSLLQVSQDGNEGFLIKAGEIAIAINESGEAEAVIDARKVVIGSGLSAESLPDWMDDTEGLIADKATIGDLNALKARVQTLEADTIKTNNLSAAFTNLGSANIATLTADTLYIKPISGMGGVSVAGAVTNLKLVDNGGGSYTLQCLKFNSSSWEDVGTFSRAASTSKVSGSWSGSTFTVASDPNGINLPVVSAHELSLNGNGSSNFSVEMKTQETGQSTQTVRDSIYIYLHENVNGTSSTVTAGGNSDGTSPVGSISTRATYNRGWLDSYGEIEVLPDEDVDLDFNDSQTVTVKAKTSPTGNLITVSSFVITSPARPSNLVAGSWNGATYTVAASAGGQALPISSAHTLDLNGNGSSSFSVEMKTQETGQSSQTVRASKYIYLHENVNGTSSTVTAGGNSDGTASVASISTRATYNAGWLASYGEIEVLPDEDVDLDFGDSQTVTVKAKTSPTGSLVTVSSFTITSPARPVTKVSGSWNGGTFTVAADANGTSLPISSVHTLDLNGNGSSSFSVEMKTQDTGEGVQTVRASKYIYLKENVNGANSTVTAGGNSDGSSPVGSISTRATYNAGFDAVARPVFNNWRVTPSSSNFTSNVTGNYAYATIDPKTGGGTRTSLFQASLNVGSFDANTHKALVCVRIYAPSYNSSWLNFLQTEIDATSVYEAGQQSGGSVTPTFSSTGIGSTSKTTTGTVKATAGSASANTSLSLVSTTYNSGKHCVELRHTPTGAAAAHTIARCDIESLCTGGASSVTVTKVALADNYAAITDYTTIRATIPIRGTASNGAYKDETFKLAHPDDHSSGHYVARLLQGSTVIGQINTDYAYNGGWDAAIASAELTGWAGQSEDTVDVSLGSGEKWKIQYSAVDSHGVTQTKSYVVQAPVVSGGSKVTTSWNGSTLTVASATSGSNLPITSAHALDLNGNGSSSFSVEMKTQETGQSSQTVRASKYIYLKENVNGASSTVTAGGNSDGSGSVASISTSATYNQGKVDAGVQFKKWDATGLNQAGWSNVIRFANSTSGSSQAASRAVYLSQDSSFGSSSHEKNVYMRDNSSDGTIVGKITVNAGAVYVDGHNAGKGNSYLSVAGSISESAMTLSYNTDYYITRATMADNGSVTWANDTLRKYHVPEDRWQEGYDEGAASATHSPRASVTMEWTGSISGRESLGSWTASRLARTYILIDAKCGGQTKKYYITLN